MTMRTPLAVLLLVAAVTTSCASSDGGTSSNEPAADAKCVKVSKATARGIVDGKGQKAGKAAAVKSPDFKKVYFIAIEFTAPGFDGEYETGVWAASSPKADAPVLAVDGFAQRFSEFPPADKTDFKIGKADPSVAAAASCLD